MTSPPPTSGRGRPGIRRSCPAGSAAQAWPAPRLIGAAVDGTPSGRDAATLGALLASATGVELMLIAVREEPLFVVALPTEMNRETLHKQALTMLTETRDTLAPDARIVVESDALIWRALRRVVRLEHRDLLVVGSAHTADHGRVRLGRNTGILLEHLECPLAIAPSGLRDHRNLALGRIGVGFDGNDESQAALILARSIASAADSLVEIRGIVDDSVAGGLRTEQIALAGDAITQRQLLSTFERDAAATRGMGVPTRLEVETGNPFRVLQELSGQVDLLVIGSSRRGPRGRVQLGETGRALLRTARCPVLLLPRPQEC